jgi:DNA repair exonuclease SbcCD ATPase subunit
MRVRPEHAGKIVACKRCGHKFRVQAPQQSVPEVASSGAPAVVDSAVVDRLQESLAEATKRAELLQSVRDKLVVERAQLIDRIEDLDCDVDRLDRLNHRLRGDVEELEDRVQKLTAAEARLAAERFDLTLQVEQLAAGLSDAREALAARPDVLASQAAESLPPEMAEREASPALKSSSAMHASMSDTPTLDISQSEVEADSIGRLTAERDALQAEVQRLLRDQHDAIAAAVANRDEALNALEARLADVYSALAQATARADALEAKYSRAHDAAIAALAELGEPQEPSDLP